MQIRKPFIGIGNRDVLHTSWEMTIQKSIIQRGFVETEHTRFGHCVVKSDSDIINNFCKNNFDLHGLSNSEDVFCVVCLNKYLDEDKKYHSRFNWEKNLYGQN